MSTPKQNRRKNGAIKLEPIDWHEFANDAVLNGNMSTLYHRPASEDPTTYASPEALLEIEKRAGRPPQSAVVIDVDSPVSETTEGPTMGRVPTVGTLPAAGGSLTPGSSGVGLIPTVGPESSAFYSDELPSSAAAGSADTAATRPTAVAMPAVDPGSANPGTLGIALRPTVGAVPTPVDRDQLPPPAPASVATPTGGLMPTVGVGQRRKTKPIRDVQDALTLAGQVLYKAMYGAPDGAKSKSCTKGYRQLAAETHLDKDTVRDLISEFKEKRIVREIGTYDPDTRSAKTYEVLSYKAILQMWRDAGLVFVTTGRTRPIFCTAQGEPVIFRPTAGPEPVSPKYGIPIGRSATVGPLPTVGTAPAIPDQPVSEPTQMVQREPLQTGEVIQALQQITGGPVDQEAADRLINNCRAVATDCTTEEIVEFAWSKAFLFRSGKIENPVGFLITQLPKHFQGEALQAYREKKRKELEAAAEIVARQEEQRRQTEREMAELEELHRVRTEIAERHRKEDGIDLKAVLEDPEGDANLKEWAKRMLKHGYRYQPRYS